MPPPRLLRLRPCAFFSPPPPRKRICLYGPNRGSYSTAVASHPESHDSNGAQAWNNGQRDGQECTGYEVPVFDGSKVVHIGHPQEDSTATGSRNGQTLPRPSSLPMRAAKRKRQRHDVLSNPETPHLPTPAIRRVAEGQLQTRAHRTAEPAPPLHFSMKKPENRVSMEEHVKVMKKTTMMKRKLEKLVGRVKEVDRDKEDVKKKRGEGRWERIGEAGGGGSAVTGEEELGKRTRLSSGGRISNNLGRTLRTQQELGDCANVPNRDRCKTIADARTIPKPQLSRTGTGTRSKTGDQVRKPRNIRRSTISNARANATGLLKMLNEGTTFVHTLGDRTGSTDLEDAVYNMKNSLEELRDLYTDILPLYPPNLHLQLSSFSPAVQPLVAEATLLLRRSGADIPMAMNYLFDLRKDTGILIYKANRLIRQTQKYGDWVEAFLQRLQRERSQRSKVDVKRTVHPAVKDAITKAKLLIGHCNRNILKTETFLRSRKNQSVAAAFINNLTHISKNYWRYGRWVEYYLRKHYGDRLQLPADFGIPRKTLPPGEMSHQKAAPVRISRRPLGPDPRNANAAEEGTSRVVRKGGRNSGRHEPHLSDSGVTATVPSRVGKNQLIREVGARGVATSLTSQNTLALVEELVRRLTKVEIDRYLREELPTQIPQLVQQSSVSNSRNSSRDGGVKNESEHRKELKQSSGQLLQGSRDKDENLCTRQPGQLQIRLRAHEPIIQDFLSPLDSSDSSTNTTAFSSRSHTSTSEPESPPEVQKDNKTSTQAHSSTDVYTDPSVSLLEELFPETVATTHLTTTDSRSIPKLNPPNTSAKAKSRQKEPKTLIHKFPSGSTLERKVATSPQSQATPGSYSDNLEALAANRNITPVSDTTTVLLLSHASTSLTPADFHRLVPRGAHIPEWTTSSTGGIARIVPGRDPASLARLPHYHLFFASPGAALAYQKNASRIHKLAAMHTPRSVFDAIPPPPGFLEDGEDIDELVKSFALVPPSLPMKLNVVPPPFSAFLKGLVKEGGYRGVVGKDGEVGKRVLLELGGRDVGRRVLYNAIKQDGFRRGILWSMVGGLRGVMSLADIVGIDKMAQRVESTGTYGLDISVNDAFTDAFSNTENYSMEFVPRFDNGMRAGRGVGPEIEDEEARRSLYVLRKKVQHRYVVEFEDEGMARRFARICRGLVVSGNWMERGEEGETEAERKGEESVVVKTEVLW